ASLTSPTQAAHDRCSRASSDAPRRPRPLVQYKRDSHMNDQLLSARKLAERWGSDPRWNGIQRDYAALDVVRLRGSVHIESTLARGGAETLWRLLHDEPYVHALGALTGNQAIQMVQGGLQAIYLSGWQVAADANLAGQMYPDQSLY